MFAEQADRQGVVPCLNGRGGHLVPQETETCAAEASRDRGVFGGGGGLAVSAFGILV